VSFSFFDPENEYEVVHKQGRKSASTNKRQDSALIGKENQEEKKEAVV
jgi:hypothetical protein